MMMRKKSYSIIIYVIIVLLSFYNIDLVFAADNVSSNTTLQASGLEKKIINALKANKIPDNKISAILLKLSSDGYFYMSKARKVRYIHDNIRTLSALNIVARTENIVTNMNIPDVSFKSSTVMASDFNSQAEKAMAYWNSFLKGKDISYCEQQGKSKWSKDELDLVYNQQFASSKFKMANRNKNNWTVDESKLLKAYYSFLYDKNTRIAAAGLYGTSAQIASIVSSGTIKTNNKTGEAEIDPTGVGANALFLVASNAIVYKTIGKENNTALFGSLKTPKVNISKVESSNNYLLPKSMKKAPVFRSLGAAADEKLATLAYYYNSSVMRNYQERKVIAMLLDPSKTSKIMGQSDTVITFNDFRTLADKYWDGIPSKQYSQIINLIKGDAKKKEYFNTLTNLSIRLKSIKTEYQSCAHRDAQLLFNFPAYFLQKYPAYAQSNIRIAATGGTATQIYYGRAFLSTSDIDAIILTDPQWKLTDNFQKTVKAELSDYMGGRTADIAFGHKNSFTEFVDNAPGEAIRKTYVGRDGYIPKEIGNDSVVLNNYEKAVADMDAGVLSYVANGKAVTLSDYERYETVAEQNATRMIRFSAEYNIRVDKKTLNAMQQYMEKYYWQSSKLSDTQKLTELYNFFNHQHMNNYGDGLPKNLHKIDVIAKSLPSTYRAQVYNNEAQWCKIYIAADNKYYTWRQVAKNWKYFAKKFGLSTHFND